MTKEFNMPGVPEKCGRCNGVGRKYAIVGNFVTKMEIKCPHCNGTGYVSVEK